VYRAHPGEPIHPYWRWPFEVWARRIAAAIGVLAALDEYIFVGTVVLVALPVVVFGYNAARHTLGRARASRALMAHAAERWLPPTERQVEQRWMWRAPIFGGLWLLVLTESILAFPLFLIATWSAGWLAGEFVDRRTSEGMRDLAQWAADHSAYLQLARERFEAEWSWAAAFTSYKAYVDARSEEARPPLSEKHYQRARAREPPAPGGIL
jgi:hypothetical protein